MNIFNTKGLITITDILKKCSEMDIFAHYIEGFHGPHIKFRSELRKDKDPSCVVYFHSDKVFYKDFGDNQRVLTCFGYVMEYLKKEGKPATYQDALNHIYANVEASHIKFNSTANSCDIEVVSRDYSLIDQEYWNQYGGTIATLKLFNIIPITSYTIYTGYNISTKPFSENTCIYSIERGDGISRKIYNPSAKSDERWISTKTADWIMGLDQLPATGDNLIITKAMKDIVTWYKLGFPAIAGHSESQNFSPPIILALKRRFKNIWVNYDNDETGIINSAKLCNKYQFNPLFTGTAEYKDTSDYYKQYGHERTLELMKNKMVNGGKIDLLEAGQ